MKVFLDANIIVDFLDKPSYDNKSASEVLRIVRLIGRPVFISPTTFAIVYYIFTKRNRQVKNIKEILKDFFSEFEFTTENESVMEQVLSSDFDDLEDALQYYSAKFAGVELIITKNKKDFLNAKNLLVLHPLEFIEMHYSS